MSPFEKYIQELSGIRARGGTVKETSYYSSLANLINAIGSTLEPKVYCDMQPKNLGAGIPDYGLFTERQSRDQLSNPQKPERGVIEAKGIGDDAWVTANTEQISKYWDRYCQVLVTNYRDFVLIGQDVNGQPAKLETYRLAANETEFWENAQKPCVFAQEHEEQITEYLKRVMLQQATISSPKDLAQFLASYAKDAKARVEKSDLPALDILRKALEEALGITFKGDKKDPKKGERFFKSTLVQTLFYGIFSAWVLWHRQGGRERFDWEKSARYLHVPMLAALFHKFSDIRNLRAHNLLEVLDWTADALNRVDRSSFFSKFEEAQTVQYFYEPFLEAFDPALRKEFGVWYTPPEVVQYMVARVDTVLREELQIEDGLADPNVYILDPCCGTGAFLVEVLKRIETNLKDKGMGALVGSQLKEAAMNRVFGFEILTAPFVIAHLQLGLLLQNLGVPLNDEEERVSVYLTNALTGWEPLKQPKQMLIFPELEEERDAAEKVKQEKPVLVILGNPPYNGFAGVAIDEEMDLSKAYRKTKRVARPQGQGLNELYVRFFRMAERRIVEQTGQGLICYVSNYSWLDGLSHPGMRERYLEVFSDIWIDCLNGDSRATGKLTLTGEPDPSIFSTEWNKEGIQLGTAISLLLRKENHQSTDSLKYRDIWGVTKWQQLDESQEQDGKSLYEVVKPEIALGLPFKPRKFEDAYINHPQLIELFPTSLPGVQTKVDELVTDIDKRRLISRMQQYFDSTISHEEMGHICLGAVQRAAQFDAKAIREYLLKRGFLPEYIVRYCYRPFDYRWIYWEPETNLLGRKSPDYFSQVFEGNLWIEARQKQPKEEFDRGYFVRVLSDNFGNGFSSYIPLYLKQKASLLNQNEEKIHSNLSDAALKYLEHIEANEQDLFYHTLAILHDPLYRRENSGALRQNWARIPLPNRHEILIASATLGRQIAALLDPEIPVSGVTAGKLRSELKNIAVVSRVGNGNLDPNSDFALKAGWGYTGQKGVTMPGKGKVSDRPYSAEEQTAITSAIEQLGIATHDIYLNDIAYWKNIPDRIWNYTLGGYQVIKKWLSYREEPLLGRPLKLEEVEEVSCMARRIAAILLLEPELNANYEAVKQATYNWSKPSQ